MLSIIYATWLWSLTCADTSINITQQHRQHHTTAAQVGCGQSMSLWLSWFALVEQFIRCVLPTALLWCGRRWVAADSLWPANGIAATWCLPGSYVAEISRTRLFMWCGYCGIHVRSRSCVYPSSVTRHRGRCRTCHFYSLRWRSPDTFPHLSWLLCTPSRQAI